MFEPSGRVIYSDILRPEDGFEIDFAICTTYSLDLAALLLSAVSIAGFQYVESDEALNDPLAMLKSLRDIKDKFVVFCQDDRMVYSGKDNLLVGFLDKTIVSVHPKKGSFHPKVWVVRMKRGNEIRYRFACLSRNLTFDKSWDMAVVLDGVLEDKERHEDLSKLMRDLIVMSKGRLDATQLAKLAIVQKELPRVRFEPPDDFSDDVNFIYCNSEKSLFSRLRGSFNRMLVISPFITRSALDRLSSKVYDPSSNFFLISRKDELDALRKEEANAGKKTILTDLAKVLYLNDDYGSDEYGNEKENVLHGLHAKVILAQYRHDVFVFSGSANATSSGLEGHNYEFMVRLRCNRRDFCPQNIVETGPLAGLTIAYDVKGQLPDADDLEKRLADEIDRLKGSIIETCEAIEIEDKLGEYTCYLRLKKTHDLKGEVFCWPLGSSETQAVRIGDKIDSNRIYLGKVEKAKISAFVVFTCAVTIENKTKKEKFILKLPIFNEPLGREEQLLCYIVNNKERFLKYILMLLGEIKTVCRGSESRITRKTGHGSSSDQMGMFNLSVEDLLECFAQYPERFNKIDNFVNGLRSHKESAEVIPEEFLSVWSTFEQLLKEKHD